MSAYVYTFLASDGTVLYVGCTTKIGNRLEQHKVKPWWPEVSRIESDTYPTLDEGRQVEMARIRALQPVHNMTGTDKYTDAGGWARHRAHLIWRDGRYLCLNPECACGRTKTYDVQVSA